MLDSEKPAPAVYDGWYCAICNGPGMSFVDDVMLCLVHKDLQITVEEIWNQLSAYEKQRLLVALRGRPHIASARTQFSERCRSLGVRSNSMGWVIRASLSA